jgi:Family of unknown function (DUF5686)
VQKYFIVTLFFLNAHILWAQNPHSFKGTITDTDGEALAFVAILPNDDATKGVLSDIEGRFSISINSPILSLTFRAVGVQTLRLETKNIDKNRTLSPEGIGISFLNIKLKKADNLFNEVVISAGENPADRLMRRVIANRNKNNPEKLNTFQCKTYNKMAFELVPNDSVFKRELSKQDTAKKKIKALIKNFKKAENSAKDHQTFLMETVTERRFRFPNDNFERVILNRVSGFPSTGMVALSNMVQPFSFYGDFLRLIDKDYANPVSVGSPNLYFFNIEDTLYQGIDTVFIISFHPKKGKVFEGLTGLLHINSNNWAVQNVQAKPTNPSQSTLKIEQQYHFDTTAAQWFPEQLNFEWIFAKYPNPFLGMRVVGRSYVSDVSINPLLKQRDFNPEMPLIVEDSAFNQPEIAWLPYRKIAPLSTRELRTYKVIDSLSEKRNLAVVAKWLDILVSGRLPIKKTGVNLDLSRLISSNDYETFRFGVGFTTAQVRALSRPKRWELSNYVGYGLRDSAWKYGGSLKLRIAQGSETTLQLNASKDIREPGAPSELDATGFISRGFYAKYYDNQEEFSAIFSSRINKRFFLKLTGQQAFVQPNYAYTFVKNNGEIAKNFHFTELTTYVKYVFNEQNRSLMDDRANETNKIPVFEIGYTRGTDKISLRGTKQTGGYNYEKWLFAIHQSIPIRRLGRATWRIEGGKVSGNVPFSKLFTLNQSGGGGASIIALPNTFQTLKDSVWLSDKFINVYFSQSFGNILYRSKHSSPQLSLVQNMAYGQLSNPEAHQGITFQTPTKPLFESGLILDNLLTLNYINFANFGIGGAFYYRWGNELTKDNYWQVLNPRLSFKIIM